MAIINEGHSEGWVTADGLRTGVLARFKQSSNMLVLKHRGVGPSHTRVINVETGIGGFQPESLFRELIRPCTIELLKDHE